MTPCMEYLTDRIFNNSVQYYVLVRHYVSHSNLTKQVLLAHIIAQIVQKQ